MAQDEKEQILQRKVWQARLPLEIRLAASESRTFDGTDPYLVSLDMSFSFKMLAHQVGTRLASLTVDDSLDRVSTTVIPPLAVTAPALVLLQLFDC
jgi:hypothetical protein